MIFIIVTNITPVRPMLPSILPCHVPEFSLCKETAIGVLLALAMIGVSVLIGWILTNVMKNKGFKTNLTTNLILSGALSLVLFLRYGFTVTAFQGLLLAFVLLYATCSDLTSHTVDDFLWVMIVMLGFCSVITVGMPSMLLGAVMVFTPQLLTALFSKNALGGADIKLSTSLAFLLGWQKGLAALMLGLLLAVVVMSIVRKIKKTKKKYTPGSQSFALVPFLSIAAVIMFII